MKKDIIRLLKAEEIECRVSTVKENGVSLLLYKDARVDQRILDETFGIFGWERKHESINGNLYCTVSIRDKETGEWISKQDVGTSGMAEQEKSQASDSFKRACFNVGIGRELYSAPFIWITIENADIRKRGDKFFCNDRFAVSEIDYNGNREIAHLVITNAKGKVVYQWDAKVQGAASGKKKDMPDEIPDKKEEQKKRVTKSQISSLQKELKRTGVKMEQVTERYHVEDPDTMSDETYQKIMRALAVTEPKTEHAA